MTRADLDLEALENEEEVVDMVTEAAIREDRGR